MKQRLSVDYIVNYTKKPLYEVLTVFRNNYIVLECRSRFVIKQHEDYALDLTVKHLL